jgi:hypothetical protein
LGVSDLGSAGAGLAELGYEGFNIDASIIPERRLSDTVLVAVAIPAKAYGAPVIRFLRHARAAAETNMRDLDRAPAASGDAAFMRAHEIAVSG